MANQVFLSKTALTGGGATALDSIDGAGLVDGDFAIVTVAGISYLYKLDADSAAAESSPAIIAPDTNGGDKRWLLQLPTQYKEGSLTRDNTLSSGDVAYTGVGFKPRAIHFIASRPGVSLSVGFFDGTTQGDGFFIAAGAGSSNYVIHGMDDASNSQVAIVKTLDADGFALTWTKVNSPTNTTTVKYFAMR